MLAVTIHLDDYTLEAIYTAIFMLAMLAAIWLGRWTTKNLLVFMFCIAVLLFTAKAAKAVLDRVDQGQSVITYTV